MESHTNLKGKAAIVTGASRGIGRAIALALAREGVNVMLAARDQQRLQRVAEETRQNRVEADSLSADMRDEAQIKNMIAATVKRFGRLDILVNNAGLGYFKPVSDLSTAEWDEMFGVNLRGVFLATREALPHLRQAGESFVVNVASLAGKNTFANGAGYTATKWGLRAFAQCLMLEERKNGLRVLTICPGSVATDFGAAPSREQRNEKRNIIMPEDVADGILAALKLPQRSMISEIDIRPSNP